MLCARTCFSICHVHRSSIQEEGDLTGKKVHPIPVGIFTLETTRIVKRGILFQTLHHHLQTTMKPGRSS